MLLHVQDIHIHKENDVPRMNDFTYHVNFNFLLPVQDLETLQLIHFQHMTTAILVIIVKCLCPVWVFYVLVLFIDFIYVSFSILF